jgi:intein-encoded DNA endonuclease-like protein
MINTCEKCKTRFNEEKFLELSHDIPKYIGGEDIDGDKKDDTRKT